MGMKYLLTLIIAGLFTACQSTPPVAQDKFPLEKGAYLGTLESVSVHFNDSFDEEKTNPSNNCGYEIADYKIFTANAPPLTRVQIMSPLGEDCFGDFADHRIFAKINLLLLAPPTTTNEKNNSYYTAKIFPVYTSKEGPFADVNEGSWMHAPDNYSTISMLTPYGIETAFRPFKEPINLGEWQERSGGLHFWQSFDTNIHELNDGIHYLTKGLMLSDLFPDIIKYLETKSLIKGHWSL